MKKRALFLFPLLLLLVFSGGSIRFPLEHSSFIEKSPKCSFVENTQMFDKNISCAELKSNEMIETDYSEMSTEELAYCNLNEVPEEWIVPVLEARNIIIHSYSWTLNNAGSVRHSDGTYEILPDFYELFPADWDIPAAGGGIRIPESLAMTKDGGLV